MEVTIGLEGRAFVAEMTELKEWLHNARIREVERVTQREMPPKPGEQGPELLAILTIVLGSQALVELVRIIHRYIEARTPKIRIEIKKGEKSITIDCTNPPSLPELVQQAKVLASA
jgi:hypothetical protein